MKPLRAGIVAREFYFNQEGINHESVLYRRRDGRVRMLTRSMMGRERFDFRFPTEVDEITNVWSCAVRTAVEQMSEGYFAQEDEDLMVQSTLDEVRMILSGELNIPKL